MASNFSLPYHPESKIKVRRIKKVIPKEALDCYKNSPYWHLRKCLEKSVENIHTDVKV